MDYIKNLIAALFTGLAAYLSPLSGELSSLLAVFLLNFFVGLLAGLIINKVSIHAPTRGATQVEIVTL